MAKKPVAEPDGSVKTVEVPEPLKRKCELKQVLPAGVIALLASAPHNETVRNVLLAHLKVPVPEELKSFKDIQDWIEFNIEPPSTLPVSGKPSRDDMVELHIIATDTESGSCSYSEDVAGEGSIRLSRDSVLEAAANSDDPEDFYHQIRDAIYNDVTIEDYISLEPVRDTQIIDDREMCDHDGITVEIPPITKEQLKEMLRTLDLEQYERLFE